MENKYKITEDGEAWNQFMESLIAQFKPGQLIAHEVLWHRLLLREPKIDEYETTEDFIRAFQLTQFEYMSLVDKLRWDILELHRYYLKNQRGEGYYFLPPNEQVQYAYDTMVKEMKKTIKEGFDIAQKRRVEDMPQEAVTKDNDLLASMGMIKRLFSAIK